MKTHPHPERPDRLRAIAASLATAGVLSQPSLLFPERCSRLLSKKEKVFCSRHYQMAILDRMAGQ